MEQTSEGIGKLAASLFEDDEAPIITTEEKEVNVPGMFNSEIYGGSDRGLIRLLNVQKPGS